MAMNPAEAAQNIKARIDLLDPSVPQDNTDSITPFAEEILAQVGEIEGEGGFFIPASNIYFSSNLTSLLPNSNLKFVLEQVDSYLVSFGEDLESTANEIQTHIDSPEAHAASSITADPSFDDDVTAVDVQAMFQEFKQIIDSNVGVLAELE